MSLHTAMFRSDDFHNEKSKVEALQNGIAALEKIRGVRVIGPGNKVSCSVSIACTSEAIAKQAHALLQESNLGSIEGAEVEWRGAR